MGKAVNLAVKIVSDADNRGFKQSEDAANKWSGKLDKANKAAAGTLLAAGGAALFAGKAAADDAQSQAILANSMEKATGASKKQVAQTESWIDAQARATGIADDKLRPAMGTLVTATGSVTKAQDALKIAMDVSTKTGKPLQSISDALAKAYAGNTASLGKLVPGMDKTILASGDMSAIMAELERTTGGAAAAAANAPGNWSRAKVALDETVESIGGYLLPAFTKLSSIVVSVTGFIDKNQKMVLIAAGVILGFAAAIVTINTALGIYRSIVTAATAVQAAFNLVMSLNPIMLVVLAVIALVAAIVIAYQKSETFRNIVQAVGRACADAFQWVVDKVSSLYGWIKDKLVGAFNTAKDTWLNTLNLYLSPIQWVIDKVSSLIDWIKKIKFPSPPKWMTSLGSKFGLGGPPPEAAPPHGGAGGGYAYSGLGGRGGPGDGGFVLPMGGRSGAAPISITINGAVDPVGTRRELEKLLGRGRTIAGAT